MTNKEALHIVANPHLKWKCVDVDSALTIIKNALDKQTPMRPDYIADGYADGLLCYDYAKCPICGHDFEYGINDWESDYCSDCGQRLDWSET